jgi:O-antigen/teichoic acid export membrane protein
MNLRVSASWTLAGNIVLAACQWGVLAYLAKTSTSTAVGDYALALAIVSPVLLFSHLGLRTVQATDAAQALQLTDCMAIRTATSAAAIGAVLLMVTLSPPLSALRWLVVAVLAAKVCEAMSDVCQGSFMRQNRMDLVSRSLACRGVGCLAVAALFLRLDLASPATSVAWGVALATLGMLFAHDLPAAVRLAGAGSSIAMGLAMRTRLASARWWRGEFAAIVRLSWPLGLVALLISLNPNIPRYFLAAGDQSATLGLYAAAAFLMIPSSTIVNAVGQAAMPTLARLYLDDRRRFRSILRNLIVAGGLAGAVLVVFTSWFGASLLAIVYTEEYRQASTTLTILSLAAAIGSVASFLWYGATSARALTRQIPIFAATLCVNVLVCAWLVPTQHADGAALAVLAGAIVQLAGSALLVHRVLSAPAGDRQVQMVPAFGASVISGASPR